MAKPVSSISVLLFVSSMAFESTWAACVPEQEQDGSCQAASADTSSMIQSAVHLGSEKKHVAASSHNVKTGHRGEPTKEDSAVMPVPMPEIARDYQSEDIPAMIESGGASVQGVEARVGHADGLLSVSFQHQGKSYTYELFPHNVFKEGAKVYAGGVELNPQPAPRTYRLRREGKWASATHHDDGSVHGLFEDNGQVMELVPIAHQDLRGAETLLQKYDGDLPAHLVRWVAPPTLGGPGVGSTRAMASVELGASTSNITISSPTISNETGHVPVDPNNANPRTGAGANQGSSGGASSSGVWTGTPWFPGCYSGDSVMHEFIVAFASDKAALDQMSGNVTALQTKIATALNEASFVYEKQLNIELKMDLLEMETTSTTLFGDCVLTAPATHIVEQKLYAMKNVMLAGTMAKKGAQHLWTGCGGQYGTVGIAYMDNVCSSQGINTGVNKIHCTSPWLTFAHELGHNFGASHSFEDGQGTTGGVMDYGDGKLNGAYQFNTKYRKNAVCLFVESNMYSCASQGFFQVPGAVFTPTTSTTTTVLDQSNCVVDETSLFGGAYPCVTQHVCPYTVKIMCSDHPGYQWLYSPQGCCQLPPWTQICTNRAGCTFEKQV